MHPLRRVSHFSVKSQSIVRCGLSDRCCSLSTPHAALSNLLERASLTELSC